jgi:hypothetical protein
VCLSESWGKQHLDALTNELAAHVAEQVLGLFIDELDDPTSVDNDHRVRGGLEERTKPSFAINPVPPCSSRMTMGDNNEASRLNRREENREYGKRGERAPLLPDVLSTQAQSCNGRADKGGDEPGSKEETAYSAPLLPAFVFPSWPAAHDGAADH